MSDISSVETSTIPEGEKLSVHPLNQLDDILYQVATEDFKDNPSVLKVLAEISKRYFKDAESFRQWFSGQAEDYGGQGVKKEALSRPTYVGHTFLGYLLDGGSAPDFASMLPPSDRLRPETTTEIAEAITKRLGVFDRYPDKHSLEDFKSGRQSSGVEILLDGKGTVLSAGEGRLHYGQQFPKIGLSSSKRPGVWSLDFYIPPHTFDESLKQPLTPSKFTAVPVG